MDIFTNSKMWEDYVDDPVTKEIIEIIKYRIELYRNDLESGQKIVTRGKDVQGNALEETEYFSADDLRVIQGEIKGLRFLLTLYDRQPVVLKELEQMKEKELEKDGRVRD